MFRPWSGPKLLRGQEINTEFFKKLAEKGDFEKKFLIKQKNFFTTWDPEIRALRPRFGGSTVGIFCLQWVYSGSTVGLQ